MLFDDGTMTIYYNATGEKSKQLKIADTPDVSKEIEYIEQKKNNPNRKGSDYSYMAEILAYEFTVKYLIFLKF